MDRRILGVGALKRMDLPCRPAVFPQLLGSVPARRLGHIGVGGGEIHLARLELFTAVNLHRINTRFNQKHNRYNRNKRSKTRPKGRTGPGGSFELVHLVILP